MKYGQAKYGEGKYGRFVNVGGGTITATKVLTYISIYLMDVGGRFVTTTKSIKKTVFKNIGNTVKVIGNIKKAIIKAVFSSSVFVNGSLKKITNKAFSKTISVFKNMFKKFPIKNVGGEKMFLVSVINRFVTKHPITATINICGNVNKIVVKKFYG
ncbi:hypothetical protein M0P98_09495, partial [bacterium]|nr:hypothetical protein [bacterium]